MEKLEARKAAMKRFETMINTADSNLAKELVADNAHKNGKTIAVSGETAADTGVTKNLLALKIDELVLRPASILKVKATVRETDTSDAFEILKGTV